jgi:hypothetical protein
MSDLHTQIRTTLARLELCSSAATQAFNPGGGRNTDEHPGGKRPPGGYGADSWYRARLTDLDNGHPRRVPREPGDNIKVRDTYQRLLNDARAELASITGRNDKAPGRHVAKLDNDQGIQDAVLEDAPGKPAEQVAVKLGVSRFLVRRIYITAGLDPHDGTRRDTATDTAQQARARLMAANGQTQKQIAFSLNVNQGTVSRWLNRCAA